MKIVKRGILVSLFLLFAIATYAQDEIYNEKQKQEIIIDSSTTNVDEKDINNYVTEKEYYAKQQKKKEIEIFTEDNLKEKRKDNGEAVQIAAEIVLEVFIHAVFIVATFWN